MARPVRHAAQIMGSINRLQRQIDKLRESIKQPYNTNELQLREALRLAYVNLQDAHNNVKFASRLGA